MSGNHFYLFQTDPPYSKASLYAPKGWTDTLEGFYREGHKLVSLLMKNQPYTWMITINFHEEMRNSEDVSRHKEEWQKVVRRLRHLGFICLWLREPTKGNKIHYHLVSRSLPCCAGEREVRKKVREALGGIESHVNIKQIEGNPLHLLRYMVGEKGTGKTPRLFCANLGLRKHGTIGDFWTPKSKGELWEEICEESGELKERIDRELREEAKKLWSLLRGEKTLKQITYMLARKKSENKV